MSTIASIFCGIAVNEETDGMIVAECCYSCGSLGVVHFQEKDFIMHRCLRCLFLYYTCISSAGKTREERRNNNKEGRSS